VKISRSALITVAQTLYSGLVAVGVSYIIGFATKADLLLVAALPLGIALVLAFSWLPPRPQLLAWSATTAWLLSTVYLGVSDLEWFMLFLVLAAAIAGAFWSPWFLVAIWFVHPLWDLIPRDLPDHQHDLPLACLIYDLVVALYLLWRTRRGFFKDAIAKPKTSAAFLNHGWSRTISALLIGLIVAIEITAVGYLSTDKLSVWYSAAVAFVLIAATLWLPKDGQRAFWLVFTVWTGMSFAHSGEPLELAVFALMIALAVFGQTSSPYYWAIAWAFHAAWNLFPRDHEMSATSALMGHWMIPLAGFLFEITVAAYLLFMSVRKKL
jgi:hypothetical protein